MPRILVVDDSRIVRVSLASQLRGHYDVREESDGEAAWQALVVDQEIHAVISDLQMPRLDGYGLLERLRSSELGRLRQMPFILVSGEETEEERQRAKGLGVSDFITKGVGSAEVLARLDNLLALSRAQQCLDETREERVTDPVTGLFTRKYLELQADQALSLAARHGGEVSVLVLGFDDFEAATRKLGQGVADEVENRLAKMLAAKIRKEDSLGHFGPGQYAIVSPGTPPATCAVFAERVRQAVAAAQVASQGRRVALTVSVGVAATPGDQVDSAAALLELAGRRMAGAMASGGNRVLQGGATDGCSGEAQKPLSLALALEFLKAGRPEAVRPHLASLGRQLLPLLQVLDRDLELGLPLAELENRLRERAR